MAPSPPSKVPGKMRRFAERHRAPPQIAPERIRKAIGRRLVRLGTKGSLSAINSPRPNTEIVEIANVEPSHARRESCRSSRCRCAAPLPAAGAIMVRKPATIPIEKADKAKARSEDIRSIYVVQLLSQGIIIFGSGLVEGSKATLYPELREGLAVRRLACSTKGQHRQECPCCGSPIENQPRSRLYFQFGN